MSKPPGNPISPRILSSSFFSTGSRLILVRIISRVRECCPRRWYLLRAGTTCSCTQAGTLTCNRLGKAPSHCLNLLYAAGRTAVLTNDPPPEETDEKAAASETSSQAVPPET